MWSSCGEFARSLLDLLEVNTYFYEIITLLVFSQPQKHPGHTISNSDVVATT